MRRHHLASPRKGILIDAMLLTAYIVGMLGPGEVEKFKRTRAFTTDDVQGIDDLVRQFGWICTTPHVIAEVSNLLDWLDPVRRQRANELLAKAALTMLREIFRSSKEIVATQVYFKLGVTDAGLFLTAREQNLVLVTADLPLYHYASGLKVEAINFNHIREQWLSR